MDEVYPHTSDCSCDNCAPLLSECDGGWGDDGIDGEESHGHCWIRVMGHEYLSCMLCGRWLRETGNELVSQ